VFQKQFFKGGFIASAIITGALGVWYLNDDSLRVFVIYVQAGYTATMGTGWFLKRKQ